MSAPAKHTPGPWLWRGDVLSAGPKNSITVLEPKEGRYYSELTGSDPPWLALSDANAALIAAAPDLYEFAAEFLRVWTSMGETDSPLEAMARAAIAKAEGRP